jgi:hypothetical protein
MEQAGNPEQQPQNARIVQVVGNYLVGPTVGKGMFMTINRSPIRVRDPNALFPLVQVFSPKLSVLKILTARYLL